MTTRRRTTARTIGLLAGGVLAASMATARGESGELAGKAEADPLLQARFAAVDGRFEECAKLADEARRRPDAVWQAHNVFATCEVFAADAAKDTIGAEAYIKRIEAAIGALRFLLSSPGVLVAEDRRRSIGFMIEELDKRIAKARSE